MGGLKLSLTRDLLLVAASAAGVLILRQHLISTIVDVVNVTFGNQGLYNKCAKCRPTSGGGGIVLYSIQHGWISSGSRVVLPDCAANGIDQGGLVVVKGAFDAGEI